MSFLGKMFGKKDNKAPTTGEAIQKLRETEDMLLKKQDFLEKKIESELAIAKKNAKTNKRAALQAIKRKKRHEAQLAQIDGTLTTMEQQREALEGANTNTAVLQTMGEAAKSLKKAHEGMNVDDVHEMLDDIAEQQDVAKEISDAISSPTALANNDFDEDELEAELEELEREGELEEQKRLDQEFLDVGPSPAADLPEVPSTKVPSAPQKKKQPEMSEEEKELAELAAFAS